MKNRIQDVIDFVTNNSYDHLSWLELGVLLNMNERTVRNHFKALNLTKSKKSLKNHDKYNLIQNLIDQGFSQKSIADRLNLTVRQVTSYCNKHGLKNRNRGRNIGVLNRFEYQTILGSLLGDGHLSEDGRLRIKHSKKQLAYAMFKAYTLSRFIGDLSLKVKDRYDKRTGKIYKNVSFSTGVYDYFFKLRKEWYPHGIKTLNREHFKSIDAFGLTIWFMDDGFRCNNGIKISTDCFSLDDVCFMQTFLEEKFGLKFLIDKRNRIYLLKKEYIKFHKLISEFIIPSMKYKLQNI